MFQVPPILAYLLVLAVSYLVCAISIPSIITTAQLKHLFDEPDSIRKLHGGKIPNLGGMAIFFAFTVSSAVFEQGIAVPQWRILIASALILFVTGLKDDLVGLDPNKKFAAQFLAAFIVLYFGNLQVQDLQGLFGIHQIPYGWSLLLSMVGLVFVINAYNLIDGVDGLAGGLGLLAFSCFGAYFVLSGQTGEAILCLAMVGALLGFLRFNLPPARIFMGDTGSLLIGFLCGVLCLVFVKGQNYSLLNGISRSHRLLLALSIIFIPVLDTFRVFSLRILRKKSPFFGDRSHIHHILLDCGMSHSWASATILLANIVLITLALLCKNLRPTPSFLILFGTALVFVLVFWNLRKRRQAPPASSGPEGYFAPSHAPEQP